MIRSSLATALATGLLVVALAGLLAAPPVGAGSDLPTDRAGPLALSASTAGGPAPGSVNLSVTLRNEGSSRVASPVVRVESVPEGWSVADADSPGGLYRPSTREWLWMGIDPGESVDATATVSYPGNATGTHTLRVVADDADGHNVSTTVRVSAGGGGGGNRLVVVGLLVLALGAFGVGWWYRSQRQAG